VELLGVQSQGPPVEVGGLPVSALQPAHRAEAGKTGSVACRLDSSLEPLPGLLDPALRQGLLELFLYARHGISMEGSIPDGAHDVDVAAQG